MVINNAISTQALGSDAAGGRVREVQRLFSAADNVATNRELDSARAAINRDRVTLSPQAASIARTLQSGNATTLQSNQLQNSALQNNSVQNNQIQVNQAAAGGNAVAANTAATTPIITSGGSQAVNAAGGQTPAEVEEEIEAQELEITRDLAERDREVRTHEQAHAALGGQYASAPSYTFERGPDGRQYAVEGEVQIDTAPIPNDPEATLQKAEVVQRAALGVAEPSPADRAVAAEARVIAAEARAEIIQQDQQAEEAQQADGQTDDVDESERATDERNQALRDEQAEREENTAQAFDDFNDRLREVSRQLAEINERIISTGSVQPAFPVGSFLDQFA